MNLDKLNTMCQWDRKKAIYLMNIAENKLNMDLTGYGEIGVNQNSGYTYLWLENYPFCLYMPIYCERKISNIYVLHTNFENGDETEKSLVEFNALDEIYNWINELEKVD